MKKPTIEDLTKELEAANNRIKILSKQIAEQDKVRRLIIAAGLVSDDKFKQAEDLLHKDD